MVEEFYVTAAVKLVSPPLVESNRNTTTNLWTRRGQKVIRRVDTELKHTTSERSQKNSITRGICAMRARYLLKK